MAKTNKEIVVEYLEQVINQKRLDLFDTYISPDWVDHSPPYVGIGIYIDTNAEPGKAIIRKIASGSPADGILQPGDEVLSIFDDHVTVNTYEDIKTSNFGPGMVGTAVNYQVRREGQEHTFSFQRTVISGFDHHWEKEDFENFLRENCPDLHFETKIAFEEGDLVAIHGINSGTWLDFGTSVIFGENSIFRVKDGKIVESWMMTDDYSMMRQQGYQMLAPEKKAVP